VAVLSLCAINRQVNEMTLQRQFMISKERARISMEIVSYEFGEIPMVKYKLICHGTTPASIVSSWQSTELMAISDIPWPTYAYGTQLIDLPSVVSNGTTDGYTFIMETDRDPSNSPKIERAISDGEKYLHFRVRIVYRDIFSEDLHEFTVNKIFGVETKLSVQGNTVEMKHLNKGFAQWRDSAYKYGQENY